MAHTPIDTDGTASWADGYGRWHVKVWPTQPETMSHMETRARMVVRRELLARTQRVPLSSVQVEVHDMHRYPSTGYLEWVEFVEKGD